MTLPSYPSPKHLGDKHILDLLNGPVVVQEKVDGSQFSFGVDHEGNLYARSRGGPLNVNTPDKLFAPAVEMVRAVRDRLAPGAVYRGEAVTSVRHNRLKYGRTPAGFVALFDVKLPTGRYANQSEIDYFARELGFDAVPLLAAGVFTAEDVVGMVGCDSFLGGCKAEGVVVKNYALANAGAEHFAGKVVSEAFKEVAKMRTKSSNDDPLEAIIETYATEARWAKARQHLREAGTLTDSPADIGALIKEVQTDIEREHGDEIRAATFAAVAKRLRGGFVRGLPEWYKKELGFVG